MKIVLASRNRGKIAEMQKLLSDLAADLEVLSLDDIGFFGEIEENGTTFEENAKIKASVPASMGYIGVADDSGLEVDALDGAPGVYSARYSGEGATDGKNNEKLLRELANIPDAERTARFRSVIACVFPNGDTVLASGSCEGTILREARGEGGFGYDPLFYYAPYGKSFGEMQGDEKNGISHRGRAMAEFKKRMKEKVDTDANE